MIVCMKWAKGLMVRDLESKALCDSLNGEFAELFKFFFFHNDSVKNWRIFTSYILPLTSDIFRYSSVLLYSPVWFEYVTNLRNSHLRS